jgi:hypothetical protein
MTFRPLREGVFAAVFLAAAVARAIAHPEADIAWLLTLGEKWLDGARLYTDIIETNPPGAILLYMPAVLLARAIGLAPEIFVVLLTTLGAGVSLWLAWRIVNPPPQAWPAAALALGLLLILPDRVFGQRDHAALIFLLPVLACYSARADRKPVSAFHAMVAGLGGGIALCLRPHYALALGAALAFTGWRGGGRALITAENATLALTGLAYGLLVWFAFPAYLRDVLPLVASVYAPVHRPWSQLLGNPSMLLGLASLAGLAVCSRRYSTPVVICMLAGLGGLAAMLLQGKGWPYHGYFALALLLFALGCACDQRPRRLAGLALFAGLFAFSYVWLGVGRDTGAVAGAVAQLAPPRPKLITISPDIGLGEPLTREVGGSWVGSRCSLWISAGVEALLPHNPSQRDRLMSWEAHDRQMLVNDIQRGRPDVVLIEQGDWHRWAFKDAATAKALGPYRKTRTVSGVEIWLRADPGIRGRAAL